MSVLDILPPSPPTTNHRDRISIPVSFRPVMSTPDDSPASFLPSSGTGTRKRVEFSPWPNVVDPLSSTPSSNMTTVKPLPPSRDCQTYGKSILKPYSDPAISIATFDGTNETPSTCPITIEAIAQQLSNNNKGSSLDAYQTLSQVIKAYDEIPEDVNTRSCIANILRCIKRDLSMQDQTQSSPIDTNLMTQALKVAVILVWSEHLSPLLTDEFRVFIVDRSINVIAEHVAPKVIIIHYMHLLAMQHFRPGMLSSNNRAARLLEALQDITNHVQGKGAIAERLLIYQKLIEQAKPTMKARASLWIKEVFLGLSSSVKDVRDKALSVSTRTCAAFPSSPTVSTAAREALASTITDKSGNSRTLSVVLTQRLEKMVAAKDEAAQVPQIWALSMLLCNSIDVRLDSWSLLKDWLKVIQRCFNCSDTSVKSQAFPAWNRFIYISRPHEASENVVSILAKPIIVQLERTSSNTTGKGLRPAAVSSYCMLLYHAFRPAASHKQYTRMWNEYIVKIMGSQFLSQSTANADLCSRILLSLMWKEPAASRIWNENRAHENTYVVPEELPSIDCKWIRSKTEAILQLFRLVFNHSVWGPSVQHSDQAHVAKAWRYFLKAIRESASKEIKPSVETKKALSSIIQFIQETSEVRSDLSKFDSLQGRSQLVCTIAVAELGTACFIEAMEADTNLRSSLILCELIQAVVSDTKTSNHNSTLSRPRSSSTGVSQSLQRCTKILDDSLSRAYESYTEASPSFLRPLIDAAYKTLKTTPSDMVMPALSALQQSLSTVMMDRHNFLALRPATCTLYNKWIDLSKITIEKLTMLPLSVYPQFDHVLAAILSSHSVAIQNQLLEAWNRTKISEEGFSYGPKLLDAINLVKHRVEISLPGVQNVSVAAESQAQHYIQIDSMVTDDQEHLRIQELGPDIPDITVFASDALDIIQDTGALVTDQKNVFEQLNQNGNPSRTRHDDSQIHFVPVNSSPKHVIEAESQMLTERQREVRDRQRMEQVVTFPDLRSSPRSRSSRDSRAPSADCEIARKVAAMEDLPSTPNISRQQDAMDEDELPSPTPKARQKTLVLADIDLLSSPPSPRGNRKASAEEHDLPSSPPKAQTDVGMDLVELDEASRIMANHSARTNEAADILLKNGTDETEIPRIDVFEIPVTDSELVSKFVTPQSEDESQLGSAVMETAQEINLQQHDISSDLHETLSFESDEQDVASDEIDELSASQLSQSLDSHLAEEARQSKIARDSQRAVSAAPKRRKRAAYGYADQTRKKRRKRVLSQSDAGFPSTASNDSNLLGEDCIIVSTSPPISPSRQHLPNGSMISTSGCFSSTPLVGKQNLVQKRQTGRIPLHLRSPNSQTVDNDATSTENEMQEYERASTDLLDESVYESVTMKLRNDLQGENVMVSEPVSSLQRVIWEESPAAEIPLKESVSHTDEMDVMTALQTALNNLKNMGKDPQAKVDLKAIDDLCFSIRYQAQELVRGRI